jgi:hypothetical protein
MNSSKAISDNASIAEDVLRMAATAAAMRIVCMDNQTGLHRQTPSVDRASQPTAEIEFTGRVPFGFAFTEGHEATFRVPSGHRFVIEHVNVSCWAVDDRVEVQMVTRSPRMFQHISLASTSHPQAAAAWQRSDVSTPILVHGSTDNTLLFTNEKERSTSRVPSDTYVQMWGYLEPTGDATSM